VVETIRINQGTRDHEQAQCQDLKIGEQTIELPSMGGTLGPDVIDTRALGSQGILHLRPGLSVDRQLFLQHHLHRRRPGPALLPGLSHRTTGRALRFPGNGLPAAGTANCPTAEQKKAFDYLVKGHTMLHDQMLSLFKGFRRDAHPMAVMVSIIGAMAAFYPESSDVRRQAAGNLCMFRLLAKVPTVAAWSYKYNKGEPFIYPQQQAGLHGKLPAHAARHAVREVRAQPGARARPGPHLHPACRPRAERLYVHGAHRRLQLRQPLRLHRRRHRLPVGAAARRRQRGGAEMLEDIGDVSRIGEYVNKAKDKASGFKLMGFGHRVYKNMDPRAAIMRQTCHEVLDELGLHDDPMFRIALKLEQIALEDEYFVQKKLYPNVDFYSGIVLRALGIPTSMFTAIFALARTAGWIAQWNEMVSQPGSQDRSAATAL
jgi:citrate synthase